MEEQVSHSLVRFHYHVCAVLFGTDETILKLPLTNEFRFVRRSLIPGKDHLDKIFGRDDIGLRRDYERARINDDTMDVPCIEKDVIIDLVLPCSTEQFYQEVDRDLILIDDCIRAIRFLKECSIRCKTIAFKMDSIWHEDDNPDHHLRNVIPMSFDCLIPISEALSSRDILKFHCEPNEIDKLSRALSAVHFPIPNETLNRAHRFYDLSYLTEKYISITILFTALEVLFIDNESNKKECLAKRCAFSLNEKKGDQLEYYHRIKKAYKQRSEFVHDGKFSDIEDSTIIFLRSCVRNSLLRMMSTEYNKRKLIADLKQKISTLTLDYWQPIH